MSGTVEISQAEYDELRARALAVHPSRRPGPPGGKADIVSRTVHRTMEVPVEEEVTVPVEREVRQIVPVKKVVESTVMVPETRTKEVMETRYEMQEKKVLRHKWVWKPERVEYYETVKEKVPVTRPVKYEYEEYVPKTKQIEVEVPVETLRKEVGYRKDKVLKSKQVEVEQDILYEMRPHRVGTGPMRYKERDGVVPLSKVRCGDEVFPSGVNARRPGSVRGGGGSIASLPLVSGTHEEHDAALGPIILAGDNVAIAREGDGGAMSEVGGASHNGSRMWDGDGFDDTASQPGNTRYFRTRSEASYTATGSRAGTGAMPRYRPGGSGQLKQSEILARLTKYSNGKR